MSASPTTSTSMRSPVLIATDLSEHAETALVRGRRIATALGAPFVVVHVIPDVWRHHPLRPTAEENDATIALDVAKQAAELVSEEVSRVLRVPADDYRVRIESGDPEDEIVRVAEHEQAQLVVVGARPRHGTELVLGHVAERVVRYAHTSVMIAREGKHTNKLLVATDFTEGALPALRFARMLVETSSVDATLVHVTRPPVVTPLVPALSALGNPWMPPPKHAVEQLERLGLEMLESLAREHHLPHFEQLEGDPADVLMNRANELDAHVIVMGSHGRTGLKRLVLGSVAEKVIRGSRLSVLVTR